MCGKQRKNILNFQFGKYVKDTAPCCRENLHYRPKRKMKPSSLSELLKCLCRVYSKPHLDLTLQILTELFHTNEWELGYPGP